MNEKQRLTKYRWLVSSLCVWLLCAWVAQQPVPAKKAPVKAATSPAAHRSATTKKVIKGTPVATIPGATTTINADGVHVDTESGLTLDETMPLVKGQCTVCHSSKLILQSHFDQEKWIERIRWMQRTQKLWDLGDTEKPILAYLAKYYGPIKTPFDGRRLPLEAPKWHKDTGQ
ncbi:hypothetical protein CWM47_28405 [Spirosoma pollinicola]|uniref:Cytochrome C n=2 Tax=Spirosoma pollinicola TaxID=2057025 RepID=A0A2K8ZCE0_9BACT|nr:hypothetical protein CWM47_28405 [Spirosoma pollinicola]RYF78550.1 MAG: lipase chaperone [Cytophagaceae bacterium]